MADLSYSEPCDDEVVLEHASQPAVLATVVRDGPVTAARIAELEHVSPQSIGQSVTELKARGLVRSEPDPADGRKKLIRAEASGGELIGS